MGSYTGPVPAFVNGTNVDKDDLNELVNAINAFGAWGSYAPTLGNWTKGNGTVYGYYTQIEKTAWFKCGFTFGSTSAAAANSPRLSLPVACGTTGDPLLTCRAIDSGTAYYKGFPVIYGTTDVSLYFPGTNGVWVTPSTTVPFTWTTGDSFHFAGYYEVA